MLRSCVCLLMPLVLAWPTLAHGTGLDDGNGNGTAGSNGSSGGGAAAARIVTKGISPLTRPAGGVDPNAKGRVEVRSKRGRERLVVQAERLDPGLDVQVLIENSLGDLEVVASIKANRRGQARVAWVTKKTALPLGAMAVADLAGRSVAVRTAIGDALLEGTIPDLGALSASGSGLQKDRSGLTNADRAFAPGGSGKVTVDFRPQRGRSKLDIEVEHVPAGAMLEVFIVNPASGVLEKVAELTVAPTGKAEAEFNTQDGDALPFGVSQVSELFGKAVEIRSPDGSVRFTGGVPTP